MDLHAHALTSNVLSSRACASEFSILWNHVLEPSQQSSNITYKCMCDGDYVL